MTERIEPYGYDCCRKCKNKDNLDARVIVHERLNVGSLCDDCSEELRNYLIAQAHKWIEVNCNKK